MEQLWDHFLCETPFTMRRGPGDVIQICPELRLLLELLLIGLPADIVVYLAALHKSFPKGPSNPIN